MKYLDYLLTHTYDELPPQVQDGIGRTEYTERRELALAVGPVGDTLPPALAAAFSVATEEVGSVSSAGARSRVPGSKRKSRVGVPWLLAAAGWLLFAVVAATFLLQEPAERVVYQTVQADPLPPRIVVERDTVYETKYQPVIRYRTVHDTVVVERPYPEFVTVTDTLASWGGKR